MVSSRGLLVARASLRRLPNLPYRLPSDAGVPGVVPSFAEPFQAIGDGEAGDKLHALVAELAGKRQTKRSTVAHGKISAVHPVDQESLGVQGIGHVDALPPVALYRKVNQVTGLGESSDDAQDMG